MSLVHQKVMYQKITYDGRRGVIKDVNEHAALVKFPGIECLQMKYLAEICKQNPRITALLDGGKL